MSPEDIFNKIFSLGSKPLSIILKVGPGFVGKSSQVFVVFIIGVILVAVFGSQVIYATLFMLLGLCVLLFFQVFVVVKNPILSTFEGSKAEALMRDQSARDGISIGGPQTSAINSPPLELLPSANPDEETDQDVS